MTKVFRIVLLIVLVSCQEVPDSEKIHVEKIYRTNGVLYSEVTYKGERPHGPSRLYHPDGKLFLDMMYHNGIKHGTSKQYYQNGLLYLEAEYVDGVMKGPARKFHKDGKLKAEMRFRDDFPCAGLKEYILNGDPRPHYPDIIITPENRLLTSNQYLLHISLTERVQHAEFFVGQLNDGCLHDALQDVESTSKAAGVITINVVPGESLNGVVNVIGKIQTIAGNELVVQQPHRLNIQFSY